MYIYKTEIGEKVCDGRWNSCVNNYRIFILRVVYKFLKKLSSRINYTRREHSSTRKDIFNQKHLPTQRLTSCRSRRCLFVSPLKKKEAERRFVKDPLLIYISVSRNTMAYVCVCEYIYIYAHYELNLNRR